MRATINRAHNRIQPRTVLPRYNTKTIKGYALVFGATAIWSGNFIVARVLSHSVPPVTLVVLRSLVAIMVLLPFVVSSLGKEAGLIRKHLGYLALTGFLGMTMCNTLVYIAAPTTKALNMTLIAICSPIFTIFFARVFFRDTLNFWKIIGLMTAVTGVLFLITEGRLSRLGGLTFSRGDLWMLGQAASFALYSILIKIRPAGFSPLVFLFSLVVLGVSYLIPWFIYELPGLTNIAFTPTVVGCIFYLGIGPSLLAYLFWNQSVAIIGPSRAAFVYYCLPLFSGIEGLVLLGEPIGAVHVFSGALILAGVIFSTKG